MKIITPGKTSRQRVNGMKRTCTNCDCQVEITEEDQLSQSNGQRDGRRFTILCPTEGCGTLLSFTDPKDIVPSYLDR